jgi:hypothetical protein
MAVALDTLAYARRLREAGFSEQQAEGQAEALAFAMTDTLATKVDLQALATRQDLHAFATKQDLQAFATKQDLKDALHHAIRRDDDRRHRFPVRLPEDDLTSPSKTPPWLYLPTRD